MHQIPNKQPPRTAVTSARHCKLYVVTEDDGTFLLLNIRHAPQNKERRASRREGKPFSVANLEGTSRYVKIKGEAYK